ncbi:lymphocyte activation gene 3 protein [Echinops telfairi]|uniref:Lymphocyte activation gene 3 protein n=1 Tax=Echinops telfairi TaxID=9371 RepID=A0ABM1VLM7_ECHTE|nr:lymphocyte activation gene 3 protein [Echinops telfairi]
MWETQFPVLLLLQLLRAVPVETSGPGAKAQVVWAQEGAPVQLPCSPTPALEELSFWRSASVTWKHEPDRARRYTVLRVAPGGLRSGQLPLQPRVQLATHSLQRGDFSLWLRPARRSDAGEYSATVTLRDRAFACRLRLRVGQAAVTASSPGPLKTQESVVLHCSCSRPDLPASVRWFRGPAQVAVQKSSRHHLAGSFLFLPQVGPADSGPWSCSLTYRDGLRVSATYNLTVLGLEPPAPLTVYVGAGSRVELPCRLPLVAGTQSFLTAKWAPPGGRPDLQVAGDHGNFTLSLEAVSQAQAGTYTCSIQLQGQQLRATVTLAVITVTPQSFGSPDSPKKLLCEVTPTSGQEHFVWHHLSDQSRPDSPGPWLEMEKAGLPSQPWQCQLYQGERLLGSMLYATDLSGPGAQRSGGPQGAVTAGHFPLFLILGILLLLLALTGALGFHLWRRWWRPRRFPALENGIHLPQAPSKTVELEQELELEPELELEQELELQEQEPEPAPEQH